MAAWKAVAWHRASGSSILPPSANCGQMMVKTEDVFKEIETEKLARLYLSSSYSTTERWAKESLAFKVLMDFLVGGDISAQEVYERLKILAKKEIDKRYCHPDDNAFFVYLLALQELNVPYTDKAQKDFRKGCEIIKDVENLHWARKFQTWVRDQIRRDRIECVD